MTCADVQRLMEGDSWEATDAEFVGVYLHVEKCPTCAAIINSREDTPETEEELERIERINRDPELQGMIQEIQRLRGDL